jgi:hypothetical protein
MRLLSGGVAHVATVIEDDLINRNTSLHKPHVKSLADLAASALSCRCANTAEWISVLPRKCYYKSKERYISRFLSNPLIRPNAVMQVFVLEIMKMAGSNNKTIILMLDQSKISDGFECLMVSMQTGERAIPVAWKVIQTKGAIGFDVQRTLLNEVLKMVPKGVNILLAGDRFYGTSSLIGWCQQHNWQYRIRLKSNLILQLESSQITTGEAASRKIKSLENAYFNDSNVKTNIGILHEDGHKEAWIIAMDCIPSKYKILDYGMLWGIECMFSDFKSRGFSITKTHLKHADRIERLILVLTIALYWAVSTGMQNRENKHSSSKKKSTGQ